tara:strand:+ start:791 stop:1396 length:606 start_codon:yes stop_codon:yes gene_type:complete
MDNYSIIKIVLIGDQNVGKTTFFKKILNIINNDETSTIGVDYAVHYKKFKNNTLKIHLWDTAGQERFHCIIKNYFKNTSSAILFFDLNKVETFESLEYWIKEYINMNSCNHDHPIILIGNKNDLEIKVNHEQIQELVIKYNLIYQQMSIKNSDISCVFDFLIELIYNENILKKIDCKGVTNIDDDNDNKINISKNKIKCCI